MKFNKSNINFAKRHNIDLDIDYDNGSVLFFESGSDENLLEYLLDPIKEVMTFKCQVYGNKIEDLPAHINTSKQLNDVVAYIGQELNP